MTNGDKIREMSDYELGQFLCKIFVSSGECCTTCPAWDKCDDHVNGMVAMVKSEDWEFPGDLY